MSGIIGHVMYAVLGAKAAAARRLPVAPIIQRHWASYLAGAYLGADIQTMPEAICVDTGKEVGYGTVPLEKSPLTGGKSASLHAGLCKTGNTGRPRSTKSITAART